MQDHLTNEVQGVAIICCLPCKPVPGGAHMNWPASKHAWQHAPVQGGWKLLLCAGGGRHRAALAPLPRLAPAGCRPLALGHVGQWSSARSYLPSSFPHGTSSCMRALPVVLPYW